ncbi:MAG: response regulator receiver protein, partial [Desulfobacteraceae bacterium]|nr:response regulator receiver protein [Desulfobacteraceae bacterium]
MDDSVIPDERPVALVIDDDRAARMVACALLEETGYSVEQASDGVEALWA